MNYTTVCGVDLKHLQQLGMVWPTWKKHKPSLLDHPMLIFYDRFCIEGDVSGVTIKSRIRNLIDHPDLNIVPWPPTGAEYTGGTDKWHDPHPQRKKMLSGFVHVPPRYVDTEYWLKLDTDTIATGCDDWVDENWFAGDPAIVAQKWGFTKPPNQVELLDAWAKKHWIMGVPQSGLLPPPGKSRLSHKRIISWCGFFRIDFSSKCSLIADSTCGYGQLPVPSQDGYMWYMAQRLEQEVKRINVKSRGWMHRSSMRGIADACAEAME